MLSDFQMNIGIRSNFTHGLFLVSDVYALYLDNIDEIKLHDRVNCNFFIVYHLINKWSKYSPEKVKKYLIKLLKNFYFKVQFLTEHLFMLQIFCHKI